MELKTIAHIRTDFPEKFGLPRQSGLVEGLCGTIEFEREYSNPNSVRGLEGYSHIWLIWGFSKSFASEKDERKAYNPTVRPPRLGGNRRMGVFATRSPNRPNPIALSSVRIRSIEYGNDGIVRIHVSGIDMADNTPVYDIKPYLVHIDSIPDAVSGFAYEVKDDNLEVIVPKKLTSVIPEEKLEALIMCLKEDPRPSYRNDEREYGFLYAGYEVKFTVKDNVLNVTDITKKQ